jgi:hypothetical protein
MCKSGLLAVYPWYARWTDAGDCSASLSQVKRDGIAAYQGYNKAAEPGCRSFSSFVFFCQWGADGPVPLGSNAAGAARLGHYGDGDPCSPLDVWITTDECSANRAFYIPKIRRCTDAIRPWTIVFGTCTRRNWTWLGRYWGALFTRRKAFVRAYTRYTR